VNPKQGCSSSWWAEGHQAARDLGPTPLERDPALGDPAMGPTGSRAGAWQLTERRRPTGKGCGSCIWIGRSHAIGKVQCLPATRPPGQER